MGWFRSLKRPQVSQENLLKANELVVLAVGKRLNQHGHGAFVGPHEAESICREEMNELTSAVHANDDQATLEELLDLAVAAVFAVASMVAGGEDTEQAEASSEALKTQFAAMNVLND